MAGSTNPKRSRVNYMKTIPVFGGHVAMVDDDDFEKLSKLKWSASTNRRKTGKTIYAIHSSRIGETVTVVGMHRMVMSAPSDSVVDHIDSDGLNNQKHNLRLATHSQNLGNRRKSPGKSSIYKGVYWGNAEKGWIAQIFLNGKGKRIGKFKEECDAALAYNLVADELFGEFAKLNTPLPQSMIA